MKKRPYLGFWLILSISLLFFAGLSSYDGITLGSFEIKTCDIYAQLNSEKNIDCGYTDKETIINIDSLPEKERCLDTVPKTILFIGDSMLEGLSPRLAAYAKKNNHKLYSVIWYSSTTKIWGNCDTLKHFIKKFQPNYIVVSLGANELFVKNIIKNRGKYVDNMLRQIGDIDYVWIGPPNWKEDTGINQLIENKVKPGTFFLSKNLKFDRAADGAHPTRASAIVWMDTVANWIKSKSLYPIKLDKPEFAKAKANRVIVLQPSR